MDHLGQGSFVFRLQIEDFDQFVQVSRVFHAQGDVQLAGELSYYGRIYLRERLAQGLQFRDGALDKFDLILFDPGLADEQDLQQAAQQLGLQAVR